MLLAVGLLTIGLMAAHADSIVTYSGIDSSPSRTNSDAAAGVFTTAAGGVNTIDFEGAPLGSFTSLGLGNGVTLTTGNTGSNTGIQNTEQLLSYNTTLGGSQYFLFTTQFVSYGNSTTATATFNFTTPVDAFGAYITGLCATDYRSELVQLNFSNGSSQAVTINGSPNCGTEFWGFTDSGAQISGITISQNFTQNFDNSTNLWQYGMGIDDVKYHQVPEPASIALLGTGLAGLGVLRRKLGRRV